MPSVPSNQPPSPEALLEGIMASFAALRPDPDLTIAEWSDRFRVLSRVSAGEPGRWRTSRTPFLREIMECLSPASPYTRVVFMKPAQIGGSEVLLNMLGYIIHLLSSSRVKRIKRLQVLDVVKQNLRRSKVRQAVFGACVCANGAPFLRAQQDWQAGPVFVTVQVGS